MHLNLSLLSIILNIGRITTRIAACVFDILFVPITLFANDLTGVVPREVYMPLYANSSDCLYHSRPNPTIPGILSK